MKLLILKIAIAMDLLGLFAIFFVEKGSAEYYIDIVGMIINSLVIILVLFSLKHKSVGR